jgi:thioredoxin reductase
LEKVTYRLLEPELVQGKDILVVGGGDSAIENALLLADENRVTLSYRSEHFNRLKPKNLVHIEEAIATKKIRMEYASTVQQIREKDVIMNLADRTETIPNDLVYIFVGGELPTEFLKKAGIEITQRFGYTMKSKQV